MRRRRLGRRLRHRLSRRLLLRLSVVDLLFVVTPLPTALIISALPFFLVGLIIFCGCAACPFFIRSKFHFKRRSSSSSLHKWHLDSSHSNYSLLKFIICLCITDIHFHSHGHSLFRLLSSSIGFRFILPASGSTTRRPSSSLFT